MSEDEEEIHHTNYNKEYKNYKQSVIEAYREEQRYIEENYSQDSLQTPAGALGTHNQFGNGGADRPNNRLGCSRAFTQQD